MNFSGDNSTLEGRDEARRGRRRDGVRDRPRRQRSASVGGGSAAGGPAAATADGAAAGGGGYGGGGYGGGGIRRRHCAQSDKPDEGLPKIAAVTGGGYFELTSTERSRVHVSRASPTSCTISTRSVSRRRRSTARCTSSRSASRQGELRCAPGRAFWPGRPRRSACRAASENKTQPRSSSLRPGEERQGFG